MREYRTNYSNLSIVQLTHNVRGPHDKIFDDQLEALFKELDALQSSGYSGEGFHGKGSRVGVGHSHDSLSPAEARLKSLKKLEEREKITRLLGKGGRLGGRDVDTKGKRPSDILADVSLLLPSTNPHNKDKNTKYTFLSSHSGR